MWTVQEAKSKLSNILRRARDGEPQIIGAHEPCVVLSMVEYRRLTQSAEEPHPGKWLIENLRGLGEIELPSREESRPSPFAGWEEDQ